MLQLQTAPVTASTSPSSRMRWAPLILGIVGTVIGAIGSWIPSYWGDEAASVMSATRSWSNLGALLGYVDGVHGVYYALLHVWVRVFGTSEFATRLPSAIAAGLMIAGTVVLVRDTVGTRAAILAGIVCIVLPRTTYMAIEARSYALGAAAAIWLTVLLFHLLRRRAGTRLSSRRANNLAWFGYSVAAAASMYLFLYLGLLLLVHAVVVLAFHRAQVRSWIRAAAVALLLATPIVAVGYLQREQISFLARRDYATIPNALVLQWFATPLIAALCWSLILVATVAAVRFLLARSLRTHTTPRVRMTVLALTWLVLPTSVLLLVNATLAPVYNVRYLTFCAPAAAILIALGIDALASLASKRRSGAVVAALVAVIVAASAPTYVGQRESFAKDDGSDWSAVAAYLSDQAPTGAVIFGQHTRPSQRPRIALDLYPGAFAGLQDLALRTPFDARAQLWDEVVPNDQLASQLATVEDVWAIELTYPSAGNAVPTTHKQRAATPPDIAMLQRMGYRIDSAELIHRTTVYHLVKEPA